MKLSARQKLIIYGLILGDGYLQKTGKQNARLRIEHSAKQREYIDWKYKELSNIFQAKPKSIARKHPHSKRTYHYLRLQSHSSPLFGKLRNHFYGEDNKRRIDTTIETLLRNNLTLAVWYMDDGYYYKRDKSAHIYLPYLREKEINQLIKTLKKNFNLEPKWYCRPDKKGCQLNFTGTQKDLLFTLIKSHIIPFFNYKLPLTP